jgi:hypothetical protein
MPSESLGFPVEMSRRAEAGVNPHRSGKARPQGVAHGDCQTVRLSAKAWFISAGGALSSALILSALSLRGGKWFARSSKKSRASSLQLAKDSEAPKHRQLSARHRTDELPLPVCDLGWVPSLNLAIFNLAHDYRERGIAACPELQQAEFAAEAKGYTATRHQREVGVGYFDGVAMAISAGHASRTALAGSTEAAQFHKGEMPAQVLQGTTTVSYTTTTGRRATGKRGCGPKVASRTRLPVARGGAEVAVR